MNGVQCRSFKTLLRSWWSRFHFETDMHLYYIYIHNNFKGKFKYIDNTCGCVYTYVSKSIYFSLYKWSYHFSNLLYIDGAYTIKAFPECRKIFFENNWIELNNGQRKQNDGCILLFPENHTKYFVILERQL